MTKELRKCAVLWNFCRFVLMGERLACFFSFPRRISWIPIRRSISSLPMHRRLLVLHLQRLCLSGRLTLVVLPHRAETGSHSATTFTIRELVAFAAGHVLGDEPGVNRQTNYDQLGMEVRPCSYPRIVPDGRTNQGWNPNDDNGNRKAPNDYDTSVYHTKYAGIYLDPCHRCSEPDAESDYHSDTDTHIAHLPS